MFNIKTLIELQKRTAAFNNYYTIEKLKEFKIPPEFKNEFPNLCKCGAEFIMTSDFTEPQCVDPFCPYKMAYTLSYFIKQMGFKDFADETCKTLILSTYTTFKYPSFLCSFSLDDTILFSVLGESDANHFIEIRETLLHTSYRFSVTFPALGIPGFGKNCKLLSIIKEPVILIHLLATEKIGEYLDKIGMYSPLYKFYLDIFSINVSLLYTQYAPNILVPGKKEYYIAITGNVTLNGVNMTRNEFLEECRSIKNKMGETAYELKESKSKSKLSYVIADFPSNSEKYSIGKELNCIVTANEFFEILQTNIQ